MKNKTIMRLLLVMLFLSPLLHGDQLYRNKSERLTGSTMVIDGVVLKETLLSSEKNGAKLMLAEIKVLKTTKGNPVESTLRILYKSGIPQRPRLPELKENMSYRFYLKKLKVWGFSLYRIEFSDDVELLEKK